MREHIFAEHLHRLRLGKQPAPLPAAPLYLVPSVPEPGWVNDNLWVPPKPSIASRKPPPRSKFYSRGSIVDPRSDRIVYFESELEGGLATILMAHKKVRFIHDQPPAVKFTWPDGKAGEHTFDFRIGLDDGRTVAIAVKPLEHVASGNIRQIVMLVRAQVGRAFAHKYVIRTERHITRDRIHNAELILRARSARNDDDVRAACGLASSLNGYVTLGDAIDELGMHGRGKLALIALIDEDILQTVSPCRLDRHALIRLNPEFTKKAA